MGILFSAPGLPSHSGVHRQARSHRSESFLQQEGLLPIIHRPKNLALNEPGKPNAYEESMDLLDDLELDRLTDSRLAEGQEPLRVSLDAA